ncbi:hypothetical protein G7Y89_g4765 [Cudoniella acicularis]|uniref:Heme peroxidase n=1 Tax=Cudoniella acicularis TaxID=354080 RepID=A0A8H4W4E3_9HELO|nr:hypothetical protein G7Y89_g4765 [Cudoniella acicularis]
MRTATNNSDGGGVATTSFGITRQIGNIRVGIKMFLRTSDIHSTLLACIAVFLGSGTAIPTWPSPIDELEDVMFLNTGYNSRGLSSHITPCSYSEFGPGRQTAAEWLRIGFHDMATTNVYFAPHGGIDGSIAFELLDGENIGAGFATSLTTYSGFFNSRLPIADMIALGVYASVRGCGGPVVPMRGGRVDATQAGSTGVPQPQNGQGTFINQFARMGFSVVDMIQMTACGHTLGGVHAGDFPNIVTPGTAPNDFQLFDTTTSFDNDIAVQYINGPISDPLTVGPSIASTRNSDFAVFTADGNATLKAMTNAATYNSMCSSILQRMIETVDPALVTLSDVIQPYEVKPSGLQLTLLAGGTQVQFSGDIRVRTTVRSASQIGSVQLIYQDRIGGSNCGSCTITTSVGGTANGFDDSFSFYSFSSSLPSSSSISSFTVLITLTGGGTETYNNNGTGFPVQDSVIFQSPQSCLNDGNLTVYAAVRSTVTTPVSMVVTQKVARASGTPVPALVNATTTMVQGSSIGPYNIYSASYTISSTNGTKFGVYSGSFADDFKDASALGSACAPLSSTAPTSSSTSATPVPTLAVKPTVGAYTFLGCYTEATNARALTGYAYYDYPAMTLEECATTCAGYVYWGVEYGGECYCGNSLNPTSTLAPLSDCSFTCPGNEYEYCGAGVRLELYKLSSLVSISSTVASTTSSSSFSILSSISSVSSTISSSSSNIISSSNTKSSTELTTSSTLSSSSSKTSSTSSSSNSVSSSSIQTSATSSSSNSVSSSSIQTSATSSSSSSVSSSSSKISSTSSSSVALSSSKSSSSSSSSITSSITPTSSSSSPTVSPTLHIVPSAGLYNYMGCFTEGNGVRALSAAFYPTDSQTIELCVASCSPYMYAGAEYGRECWCADSFGAGSVPAPDSDCSMTCAGNPYEYCGAGNRLSVYIMNGTDSQIVSSSSSSSSSSTSISKSSTFSTRTSTQTSSSETGSSTQISTTSSKLSSSSTSSSVSSTQSSSSSQLSSSTTSTPTPSGPAIKPQIGAYNYLSCYTEGNGIRALNSAVSYNYPSMTLEECSVFCQGYTYWGVEYGGECYCGNQFNGGSIPAPEGNSGCWFLCPGNQDEYCGAGNRLSVYELN